MLLLIVACARPPVYSVDGPGVSWSDLRRDGVGVAPVVLVRDLPAPPLPPAAAPRAVEEGLEIAHLPPPTVLDPARDAAFLRNDYVGNVRFGGGFVRTGDVALEVRARLIEFGSEDTLAEVGRVWLAGAVAEALDARKLRVTRVELAAPPPTHVPVRGQHEDDGRDNLNLPRLRLRPAPLPEADRPATAPRWLLVPYLRAYYTHNGGWFLGHQWGTTGGARVEVLLALYDGTTGQPAWWMEATGRHIQGAVSQPSTSELDQYLLWSEDEVEESLRRGLFR